MGSLGGNIHNEYVESDAEVDLFKAVELRDQKMCYNGSFVAYKRIRDDDDDEDDEEVCHSM